MEEKKSITGSKKSRKFSIINADVPEEKVWENFWKDKTPEEKMNAAEEIIRGGNATPRLQRVFRVIERV